MDRLGDDTAHANSVKILDTYLIACLRNPNDRGGLGQGGEDGVDSHRFVEVLYGSLFPGPVYASYGQLIAEGRYQDAGFTARLGRKDVHLARDARASVSAALPCGKFCGRSSLRPSPRDKLTTTGPRSPRSNDGLQLIEASSAPWGTARPGSLRTSAATSPRGC